METYTCQNESCGAEFTRAPTRGQRPKWCPDCRDTPAFRVPCCVCGAPATKRRAHAGRNNVVCGAACRAFRTHGCYLPRRAEWEHAQRANRKPSSTPKPRRARFVAGACAVCATPFVVEDFSGGARFCSDGCMQRFHKRRSRSRRRARERGAYTGDIDSRAVFESDNYVCHLCNDLTDPTDFEWRPGADGRPAFVAGPRYPSVDHVLALANGGSHTPDNARTAHMLCNSMKGDR